MSQESGHPLSGEAFHAIKQQRRGVATAKAVAKLKGKIRKGEETAEMLALYDPERMRAAMVGEGAETWKAGMIAALQPTRPCSHCGQSDFRSWAYRLFARVAKLIGADTQIVVTMIQQLGVASLEEARRAISADREAREMSQEESIQRVIEYLVWYKAMNPQEYQRLGGDRLK